MPNIFSGVAIDPNGNILVNVFAQSAANGTTAPASTIQVGGSDGTDIRTFLTSTTGQLHTITDSGSQTSITGVGTTTTGSPAETGLNVYMLGGSVSIAGSVTTEDVADGLVGGSVPSYAIQIGWNKAGVFENVSAVNPLPVTASIAPPSDNIQSGTLTALTQTVSVATSGTSALMVQITGTWTGTIDFQVSLDGSTWQSVNLYPAIPDGSPSTSSTATNGNFTLPVGGIQDFRVLAAGGSWTGTANIALTAGQGQYGVFNYSDNAANFLATVDIAPGQSISLAGISTTSVGSPASVGLDTYILGGSVAVSNFPTTFAVTQSGPWSVAVSGNVTTVDNITEWAGVTLGAPTAFGTAPSGNVIGANASLFAGQTPLTVSYDGSPAEASLNVHITGGVTSGVEYTNGQTVAIPTGTAAMGYDGTEVHVVTTDTYGNQTTIPAAPKTGLLSKAIINTNTTGANTIIAGVAGQTIRIMRQILQVQISGSGSTTITPEDSNGPTALTGPFQFFNGGEFNLEDSGEPWFITSVAGGYVLNQTGTAQLSGIVYYTQS